MAAKPCRYCGSTSPGAIRHQLDNGNGDHGYTPERFPGDRAEPLWQHDSILNIPTSVVEHMVGRRLTVPEATRLRDSLGQILADRMVDVLRTLELKG
jgi:hypothetical protein